MSMGTRAEHAEHALSTRCQKDIEAEVEVLALLRNTKMVKGAT